MAYNTWQVQVDSLRDGSYGGTYDDITAYLVESLTFGDGFPPSADNPLVAYDRVAPVSQATFILHNGTGVFFEDYTGTEALANGSLNSWTSGHPTSWTITGASGTNPEITQVSAGNTHGGGGTGAANFYSTSATGLYLHQTALTVGQRYKVTLLITKTSGTGGIEVRSGASDVISPIYSTAGQKVFYFTATSTSFRIYAIPGGGTVNLTVDSVSVLPVNRYAGVFRKGTQIRIRSTLGGTQTQWQGRITNVQPYLGVRTDPYVRVTAQDMMLLLMDSQYTQGLLQDVTVDQIVNNVFDNATVPWPYAHPFWMLGVEGVSEAGNTTTLYDHAAITAETGATVIPWFGDLSGNRSGTSTINVLEQALQAEIGGRLFYSGKTGGLVFHNRHHDITNLTVDASYTVGDFTEVQVSREQDTANSVTLTYAIRRIGAAGSILWSSSDTPITITANSSQTFNIQFRDPNNENTQAGAIDVINPLQNGVDLIANTSEDGSGTNISGTFITRVDLEATRAVLTVLNGNQDAFITTLQIRGTPVVSYDNQIVEALDGQSIYQSERQNKPFTISSIADADTALAVANWIVSQYANPLTRIYGAQLVGDGASANMSAVLTRDIGDRITITDSASGHDTDYIIVGRQAQITPGGQNPFVWTWALKPAQRTIYWLLGDSVKGVLDITTRPAL